MPSREAIAAAIDEARKGIGLTQAQLAAKVGMIGRTLQRKVNGESPFAVEDLFALAPALGYSPAQLLDRIQDHAERLERIAMSQGAANNVTQLHPRDMTAAQLDAFRGRKAADRLDEEADAPEDN